MKKVAIICSFALVLVSSLFLLTSANANPQPLPAGCEGNMDTNPCVNNTDLLLWLDCYNCYTNYGWGGCNGCQRADFNGDHHINWLDYQIILNDINQSCGC